MNKFELDARILYSDNNDYSTTISCLAIKGRFDEKDQESPSSLDIPTSLLYEQVAQ
jgi:hypothetical protein